MRTGFSKPLSPICVLTATVTVSIAALAQTDPGPRLGPASAGLPISGLSGLELALFQEGKTTFEEVDAVANGLGPRFNLDSCQGCHAQPATGGSSPAVNPQIAVATKGGAHNSVFPFLSANGPVREARFRRKPDGSPDGGVHALFVITGRSDAPHNCGIAQETFSNTSNLAFRIPTPTFGLGLVESITDSTLRANLNAQRDLKRLVGISGKLNTNGNDGTVARFGWKAQNKSLSIFSGEAYNVEVGVTNELFPQEREEDPVCAANGTPEDHTNLATGGVSDVQRFALFMKFLAPPTPAPATPSINRGRDLFNAIGCALCHTPTLMTGKSSTTALTNKPVNL